MGDGGAGVAAEDHGSGDEACGGEVGAEAGAAGLERQFQAEEGAVVAAGVRGGGRHDEGLGLGGAFGAGGPERQAGDDVDAGVVAVQEGGPPGLTWGLVLAGDGQDGGGGGGGADLVDGLRGGGVGAQRDEGAEVLAGEGEGGGVVAGVGDGDAERALEGGHAADELAPHEGEACGGEVAVVAGEEAAEDRGLAAGADGGAALDAQRADAGDDLGALDEGVVDVVVDAVELGPEGRQVGVGRCG